MKRLRRGIAVLAITGSAFPAFAEVISRVSAPEGAVVARKTGEEVRFVEIPDWRGVEVDQDLLAGDTLRTNAQGNLAIRFVDNTLVRMGRETVLRVRRIDAATSSELGLDGGTIWGRAERGGSGLTIDTPAAAAAIRGTDWSLRADGNRTTLTVLEGTVELSNPQGSVIVNQGEGAVATLGQAPRKYILVDLEEREQILLYREIRSSFASLPTDEGHGREARRRILDTPEATRSREDWLSLAEAALAHDGRAAAEAALSRLARPLPAALEARATLVEAMIAGQAMRYDEAVLLFRKALPGLSGERLATARYGEWIAASLKDPDAALAPPSLDRVPASAGEAVAQATVVAHMRGQAEAIALLETAERRFPDDAGLPAMRAGLAFELDRRDEVRAALARARAIDPDEPSYLLMSARFRATVSSDLDGALADLTRAAEIAPGDDAVWNEIGIVQSDRNAPVEADAAHRRAAALNPENAAVRANYARFLMDNDQMAAARREINAAEALDPASYAVLAAKGRYLLRMGRTAEGETALQEAAAVNPTDGDALIGLAIASYQSGATGEAAQALDNADRFDRDNPSIALMRAGIALDRYRADDAILDAREALRRRQARGGYYTGYDANRQASAVLGAALENIGLSEWGRYYANLSFDPFASASYIDEAIGGRTSPFIGEPLSGLDGGGAMRASDLQARLLDPLSIASEEKRNGIERRTFVEAALGGSLTDHGAGLGFANEVTLQGTAYAPLPISYYIQGQIHRPESARDNDADDLDGGFFQVGLRPTLTDSIVLFGERIREETGYPGQVWNPAPFNAVTTDGTGFGGAWSHVISERNVLQAFAVRGDTDTQSRFRTREFIGEEEIVYRNDEASQEAYAAYGVAHMIGIGPLTLRYGAEAGQTDFTVSQTATDLATGLTEDYGTVSGDNSAVRTYVDGYLELSEKLRLQAGAYVSRFDGESGLWGPVDHRLGLAFSPVEDHWLRAYYRQDTQFISDYTLAPVSTVGLAPMELPLFSSGQSETTALRWDGEWSERFFTAVEYQHQRFNGLTLAPEDMLTTFLTSTGTIDRLQFSANAWVADGLGVFGTVVWNSSKDTSEFWDPSFSVPLVPDYVAQVGLTYVHPSRWTATLAHSFVGPRLGSQYYDDAGNPGGGELDPYQTTDIALSWKSPSGHLEAGVQIRNIFDNDIDMAEGLPAPGRTVLATIKARF